MCFWCQYSMSDIFCMLKWFHTFGFQSRCRCDYGLYPNLSGSNLTTQQLCRLATCFPRSLHSPRMMTSPVSQTAFMATNPEFVSRTFFGLKTVSICLQLPAVYMLYRFLLHTQLLISPSTAKKVCHLMVSLSDIVNGLLK